MEKSVQWITLVIGILLILPLLGVDALGTITTGIASWLIALGVLAMGIGPFFMK